MGEQERILKQEVEKCVSILQDILDVESAKSISTFSTKTSENEKWLEDIKPRFNLMDDDVLQKLKELRHAQIQNLCEIEQKVDYYERLFEELDELQNELEVKTKLEHKRRSRLNGV